MLVINVNCCKYFLEIVVKFKFFLSVVYEFVFFLLGKIFMF